MNKNKDNKQRCENCGSGYGYFRIKEKEWQCRQCGCIKKLGDKK